MFTARLASRSLRLITCVFISTFMVPGLSRAEFLSSVLNVSGFTIYAGIVPAAITKLHSQEHAEATMHGGAPSGPNSFHYVIAIFDAKTGARVQDAEISATVSLPGHLETQSLRFDPMSIAGTVTYGAFVTYKSVGRHEFALNIKIRGAGEIIQAKFVDDYQAAKK